MNEKIKLLAEQAGLNFGTNISGIELVYGTFEGSVISHIDSEELTKFAELIVAECLAVCAVNTDDEPLDYKRGVIFAMNRCQRNIKEHFGVEE